MKHFIANRDSVIINFNGEAHTIDSSFPQFSTIVDLLKSGDYEGAVKLIDTGKAIVEFSGGKFTVQEGVVKFNDTVVDNSLTKRIIQMMAEGEDITSMVNFLNNLIENPSFRAVNETYGFLAQNDLPITEDGCFIAYKNVGEGYISKYNGPNATKFDNSVGKVCEMERFSVNDDKNQTCSAGLHFCSIDYLKGFWGISGHTMVVKINPKDVVSIPTDYNNAKGRCCKYEVMAEVIFKDGKAECIHDKSVWKPYVKPVEEVELTTNDLLKQLIAQGASTAK